MPAQGVRRNPGERILLIRCKREVVWQESRFLRPDSHRRENQQERPNRSQPDFSLSWVSHHFAFERELKMTNCGCRPSQKFVIFHLSFLICHWPGARLSCFAA